MKTCEVTVDVFVDQKIMKTKTWRRLDVMKTSFTRGWATRQFNTFLRDFGACDMGNDKIIFVEWVCHLGGYGTIRGTLSGVNGKTMSRRGIFRD